MKRTRIVGVILLLSLFVAGCTCYNGYYGGYGRSGVPYGCGSVIHNGVVDYVDGNSAPCDTDCATGYTNYGCTSYRPCGLSNCANCLGNLVNGVFVLGEGAFCLAAAPFALVGNLLCGGYGGYEIFPYNSCSNEVYYGDNCYQPHDFCNPCDNVDSCGCGSGAASSGCSRCSGGYTEGIRVETETSKPNTGYKSLTQPVRIPAYNVQTNRTRPISQTMFRQPTQPQHLTPPQRMIPPRPQVYVAEEQTNPVQ
ncbi:MAG: hypothetical protein LBI18_09190 [Planctomycetaceae bacterium]|jgi:hypothetical protein|nr:hypothetical protein [Planctomycetaceae bacterium]